MIARPETLGLHSRAVSILVEQEVKFRLSSWDEGEACASAVEATVAEPRHFETNVLYDYPDRRLAKRDEAVRVRRVGDKAWLTWKGPQHGSGRIKRRRELETMLDDADAVEGILEALGLEEAFRYEKVRATYRTPGITLTIDETPIGAFIEIEGEPERIIELADRMRLDMSQAIKLSYPRLYELHRDAVPDAPEFMVFVGESREGRRLDYEDPPPTS